MPRAKRRSDSEALLRRSMAINVALSIAVAVLAVILIYTNITQPRTIVQQVGATQLQQSNSSTQQPANNTQAILQTAFSGIDQQLNSTELSGINGEPLSYYQRAGEMLLNGSLHNNVVFPGSAEYNAIFRSNYTPLIINGKPSVIYVGAISCIFCGENRWAMALALGAFGNFSKLYAGYSSLGDGDIPTLYWNYNNYTTLEGATFGNFYSSPYINFISAEYDSPIVQGFQFAPNGVQYFVPAAPNSTYLAAMEFMNGTKEFQGTPFTFWGNTLAMGADAVIFGNSTPTGTTLPLAHMSHAQVLGQFRSFNDQFAWSEYAAADVYAVNICASINSTAPVCSLPAIKEMMALAHA